MILTTLLLATNIGLVGLSMKRLRLHVQFNRASRRGDHHEALELLRRLQRLPTTPLGTSVCETLMLRTAGLLRDWELVDSTWERYRSRARLFRRFEREATSYYAASLVDRGFYRAGLELYERALDQAGASPSPFDPVLALAQASLLIRIGDFSQARASLEKWKRHYSGVSALAIFSRLVRANLDYLEGELETSRSELLRLTIDPHCLRHLQDPNVLYSLVRALCRCDLDEPARALFPVEPGNISVPKSRELRMLAAASLAEAEQNHEKALSYYGDLKALGAVDAEAYVRASAICVKTKRPEDALDYLRAAVEYDQESHWAQIAERKLRKTIQRDQAP